MLSIDGGPLHRATRGVRLCSTTAHPTFEIKEHEYMNKGEKTTITQDDPVARSILVGKATAALMKLSEDEKRRVLSNFAAKYGWKL